MKFLLLILCAPALAAHLDDVKRRAIENNFEIAALRRHLEEKKAERATAFAAYLPTLGIAGGVDTQGGQSTSVGYLYGQYNVFRGFKDASRSQMAAIDEELAQIRLVQAEFGIGLSIEEQYYAFALKKTLLSLREEALKSNETHKTMAARRQGAGLASESDVMEFDLRESLLQSDILLLRQELEEVRIQLRRLQADTLEGEAELRHEHLKGTLEQYLKRASESPAVTLASREVERADLEIKTARSPWWPTLDLEAQVGYLSVDDRPSSGGIGMRGFALAKFDLFSGFAVHNEMKAAEARRLRAEAQLKQATQNALAEMETAFRRLKTVEQRVDVEEKNEGRAVKYYEAVLGEYRRGVKNSADVKGAAELLLEARARRASFKYQFLHERIRLERSLGRPLEVERL